MASNAAKREFWQTNTWREKAWAGQRFSLLYVAVRIYRENKGSQKVDHDLVPTRPKSTQNDVSRVITSPNAFLDRTGSGVVGGVGVGFGPPTAKTGHTAKIAHGRSPVIFVALG